MEFTNYKDQVLEHLEIVDEKELSGLNTTISYDEQFKWKQFATKLKMFSFISHKEHVSKEDIEKYTDACFDYGLHNYKGLVRGMQSGFVVYCVLACDEVDEEAIQFVLKKPKKHYAAFEMPIIYDLKNEKLYYLQRTPMWGMIYYKEFRKYIESMFALTNK